MAFGKREDKPEPVTPVPSQSAAPSNEGTSILAQNVHVDGTLVGGGMVRIEGEFKGKIQHEGQLVIAETASVKASIWGREIIIFGHVEGDLVVSGRLELKPSARLVGSIKAPRVLMSDGASMVGSFDVSTQNTARTVAAAADDHANGAYDGLEEAAATSDEGTDEGDPAVPTVE